MNRFKKLVLGSAMVALTAGSAWAAPSQMVTVNKTAASIFANIAGYQSPDPVKPGETKKRAWLLVKGLCATAGQTGKCTADIVAQDSSNNTTTLGQMTMDLESGDITPKKLAAGKYTLTVTGVAQVLITQK